MSRNPIQIRLAQSSDIPALDRLIEASVRGLQAGDYTQAQIEGSLGGVLGLDTQLIEDQTYFVAEDRAGEGQAAAVGCGGWSFRKTLFGSDHGPGREAALLDPATDAAKIRAIFVHPEWARRGIGSLILQHCEDAAVTAGFRYFEMGSTLTGVPLYTLKGYREIERVAVPLPNGEAVPVVHAQGSRLARQHGAVADVVLADLADGHVDFVEGEPLGLGLDAVAGGDVEHFANLPGAAGRASGDVALAGDERDDGKETGTGGTPTKTSVPVGRKAWR